MVEGELLVGFALEKLSAVGAGSGVAGTMLGLGAGGSVKVGSLVGLKRWNCTN